MYYLYLDESGDLGHHFQSPGASRHFVIAVLEVRGDTSRKMIEKAVTRTLNNKLRKKHPQKKNPIVEIKATTTDLAAKQYFYRHVAAIPFTISAVVLKKERLFAWGIFRKYEIGDTQWYDVFKEKVVFERVYPDK
jgi:hypothetical protein